MRHWTWPSTFSFSPTITGHRYGDLRAPSHGGADRRVAKRAAALMLLAAVVISGGAVLLRRSDDTDTREQRARSSVVQGVVTSNAMSYPNSTEQSPTIKAAVPPATVASSAKPATTPEGVAPRPSQASSPDSHYEDVPSQSSTLEDKGNGGKNHRLISLALARAHGGLENNDLHAVRSGVYWALSLQPDNRDALLLKLDLVSREKARDAALKAARSCVGQDNQQCVLQNASNALSIDSSSAEARALIAHSKVHSGEGRSPLNALSK
ncbi:hypothetical protein G3N95_05150 [Paraburkholderia sp. Tr-20389]|uniref:hypothetical protein n=1 Tax=Paraburkholderia sp. Tr-20389 TaxID=2703903 RepID=UPI00197F3DF1|nr:hypothetical protein [Paraburkholderia sp. Tr-20389]MBN3752315.1 hypothetical protein [Paraburkholderia sp. Tr-20389]